MKDILEKKKSLEETSYTDEEVDWLLKHIGDSSSEIRDEIVFVTFSKGFYYHQFSLSQVWKMRDKIIDENLLFYKIDETGSSTLTRSFSSLLLYFLLLEHFKNGPYQSVLSNENLSYFWKSSLNYLKEETDFSGYSADYGWVHAFAHFSDWWEVMLSHCFLELSDWLSVFEGLLSLFKRLVYPFTADEESRLARVIYQPILKGHLLLDVFVTWLTSVTIAQETAEEYIQFIAFKHFLQEIYLVLDRNDVVTVDLKKIVQTIVIEDN